MRSAVEWGVSAEGRETGYVRGWLELPEIEDREQDTKDRDGDGE